MQSLEMKSSRPRSFETETKPETFETETPKNGVSRRVSRLHHWYPGHEPTKFCDDPLHLNIWKKRLAACLQHNIDIAVVS